MRWLSYQVTSYDNFIQISGIRDSTSHGVKILRFFYDNLDTSVPNDPDVIIKIDTSNSLNTTDRTFRKPKTFFLFYCNQIEE